MNAVGEGKVPSKEPLSVGNVVTGLHPTETEMESPSEGGMEQKRSVREVAAVTKPASRSGEGDGKPGIHVQIQDHIGRQLRAVYDDVLNQPVPDRLLELLEELDRGKKDGEGD